MKTPSSVPPATSLPKSRKSTKKAAAKEVFMPAPTTTGETADAETFGYDPKPEDIALLAQRIYEDEGMPPARAEAHWLEAERRLREEAASVSAG